MSTLSPSDGRGHEFKFKPCPWRLGKDSWSISPIETKMSSPYSKYVCVCVWVCVLEIENNKSHIYYQLFFLRNKSTSRCHKYVRGHQMVRRAYYLQAMGRSWVVQALSLDIFGQFLQLRSRCHKCLHVKWK